VDPINGDPVVSTADGDVCSGDGLIMAPPDRVRITLNLGGNTLRGSNTGVGIRLVGPGVRVTIRNGRIRNFDTALTNVGGGTGDMRLSKLVVNNNIDGIDLEGDNHELDTNQALDNSGTGVRLTGNRTLLFTTTLTRNGGTGIEVTGDGNVIRKNKVNRSGGAGIHVEGHNNLLQQNVAENSQLDGIVLIGDGDADPATIELVGNRAVGNAAGGISVLGDNHEFSNNQGNQNGDDGVFVIGAGNRFNTTVGRENRADGVFVTGGGNVDNGGNFGKKNAGVQCVIDGTACKL
jgi:hypothetical protein